MPYREIGYIMSIDKPKQMTPEQFISRNERELMLGLVEQASGEQSCLFHKPPPPSPQVLKNAIEHLFDYQLEIGVRTPTDTMSVLNTIRVFDCREQFMERINNILHSHATENVGSSLADIRKEIEDSLRDMIIVINEKK